MGAQGRAHRAALRALVAAWILTPVGALGRVNEFPAAKPQAIKPQAALAQQTYMAAAAPRMPDLRGMSRAQAIDALAARAHLKPSSFTRVVSGQPVDTVVTQDPAPNTLVNAQTRVVLGMAIPRPKPPIDVVITQIPKPPVGQETPVQPPQRFYMPDVRGRSRDEAVRILRERLRRTPTDYRTSNRDGPPDQVAEQYPAPGAPVGAETQIVLTFPAQQRPPTITVPDLRGKTAQEARNTLGLIRLLLGAAREQNGPQPSGQILSTDPPAGAQVSVNSVVNYVETSGRNLVPQVVGLSRSAAASRIGTAGFELEVRVDKGPTEDRVAAQSPPGGVEGYVGDKVTVVLARSTPPPPQSPKEKPPPDKPPPDKPPPDKPPPDKPKPEGQPSKVPPGVNPSPAETSSLTTPPLVTTTQTTTTTGQGSVVQTPNDPQIPWRPLGIAALIVAAVATAGALVLRILLRVSASLLGGVEHTAETAVATLSGPAVMMNWDLVVEPPTAVIEPPEELPPSSETEG